MDCECIPLNKKTNNLSNQFKNNWAAIKTSRCLMFIQDPIIFKIRSEVNIFIPPSFSHFTLNPSTQPKCFVAASMTSFGWRFKVISKFVEKI